MNCTRCEREIEVGQKFFRTKRGAHHADCEIQVASDDNARLRAELAAERERVRREAQVEALEALPCENVKFRGFWRSCLAGGFADPCPRCKALNEARKGGE